jgi:hypothetical protein
VEVDYHYKKIRFFSKEFFLEHDLVYIECSYLNNYYLEKFSLISHQNSSTKTNTHYCLGDLGIIPPDHIINKKKQFLIE